MRLGESVAFALQRNDGHDFLIAIGEKNHGNQQAKDGVKKTSHQFWQQNKPIEQLAAGACFWYRANAGPGIEVL